MLSLLKLFALTILVGSNTPYWGHTYLAEGNNKIYAIRSLNDASSLCTFDAACLDGRAGVIELASLQVPMAESVTEGKESCHITLLEREAVVSDYTSGTLTIYPLDEKGDVCGKPRLLRYEGKGAHPTRQHAPHIHSSALSPDGKRLVVVDLGTDRVYCYAVKDGRLGEKLATITLPAGSGPRFSLFGNDGKYLYLLTELSDEIMVYRMADYKLQNRYPIGDDNPEGGAHIALSPDGRTLYASLRVSGTSKSNRCKVSDGVAIFKCLKDGKLERLQYLPTGGHPRHFAISPDGRALVVACRDSNEIEIYPLENGLPKGEAEKISVKSPVYVGFVR